MQELSEEQTTTHKSFTFTEKDIVFDILTVMRDFYFAEFTENGDELDFQFRDGQKFNIKVKKVN